MATNTIVVQPAGRGGQATQIVEAGESPALINNPGPNTIYVGNDSGIQPADANGIVPLAASGYMSSDGSEDLFATIPTGQTQTIYKISGVSNFFTPPSLSGLGGISLFVQATAPTGTIALNSIWFNTTNNSLEYWNGTTWVVQAFSGSQLIQAGTIVATLIAAGTVVGGIVDGTTIKAASFIGGNYFGYSVANPTLDDLIISLVPGTVTVTDSVGNVALPGITGYLGTANKWQAINVSGIAGGMNWYEMTTTDMNGSWTQIGQMVPIFGSATILNNSGRGFSFGSTDYVEIDDYMRFFEQSVRPTPPSPSYALLYANPNATLSEVHGSGFGGFPLDRSMTDVTPRGPITASLTATAITPQYTIPAGDMAVGSEYVMEVNFHGNWPTTASNLQLWISINGTQRAPFQLAGLSGAGVTFGGTVRFHMKVVTTGSGGTINVHAEGSVSDTTNNRSNTTTISPTANVVGAALNTTTATTIQLFAEWMAAGTGQSVTSDDSTLLRKGN